MAIYNAKYEFTLVDIGESGRNSDGGFFSNGHIGEAFKNRRLHIPETIPGTRKRYPYVLVGDEAFQL